MQLRRARHVVTEDQRVLDAVSALKRGDITQFGQLLTDSHLSLRNDYEVSSPGLDALVDIAAQTPVSSVPGSPVPASADVSSPSPPPATPTAPSRPSSSSTGR